MKKCAKTRNKIKQHWKIFAKLWKAFERVANHARSVGAAVYHEWPQGCLYWSNQKVAGYLRKHQFEMVGIHGRMYGLVSKCGKNKGIPINKPWKIAQSKEAIKLVLNKCDKSHEQFLGMWA